MNLIAVLRPRVFVELGAHDGDSYCAFCQAVLESQLTTRCFAIDLRQSDPCSQAPAQEVSPDLRAYHDPLYGGFSSLLRDSVDEALTHFPDASIDLLHINELQADDAILRRIESWLPKLSKHAVVLLHNPEVSDHGSEPTRLWRELSAKHPSFELVPGHGLGVVAIGMLPPSSLRLLFDASDDEKNAIRAYFLDLGLRLQEEDRRFWAMERILSTQRITRMEERISHLESNLEDLREIADHRVHELRLKMRSREQKSAEQAQEANARFSRLEEGLSIAHALNNRLVMMEVGSALRRGARQVRRTFFRPVFHLQLQPERDIRAVKDDAGEWEATGIDPCFQLLSDRRRFPSGWVLLDFAFDLPAHDRSHLFLDSGIGYTICDTIQLPPSDAGRIRKLVRLPPQVRGIRFAPIGRPGKFRICGIDLREVGLAEAAVRLAAPLVRKLARRPADVLPTARKLFGLLRSNGLRGLKNKLIESSQSRSSSDYDKWVAQYDTLNDELRQGIRRRIAELPYRPLLSVVMPTYETPEKWLRRAIDSVQRQLYENWELCIADDASTSPDVVATLKELSAKDSRIRVRYRATNGHISEASNSALELVRGEFVVLLDHDDELPEQALSRVVEELNAHPDAGVIYGDEDKIDEMSRRFAPYFKPDWNPDLFYSHNLISHLGVYRTSLVREVGGFRKGFEGAQDYDLAARIIERIQPTQIRHIPSVLYHWRAIRGSTALSADQKSYAEIAARRTLQEHFDRVGMNGTIEPGPAPGLHRARFKLPAHPPLVSVIIPTRNRLPLLLRCIDSIRQMTRYSPYEIIIVDNQSDDVETLRYLRGLESDSVARVLAFPYPFNYSAINNLAVREAKGFVLAFLNNDIEVITADWLKEMVSHAVRPEIGAVGAKLLFPNDTIQHGGIILGLGADRVAGSAHDRHPDAAYGHFGRAAVLQDFSAVTAACLVMRRTVFEEAQGFDETHLPVAYNDVDLCLRLREKGLRILWTPYAKFYHHESATRGSDLTPEKRARFLRDVQYMKDRWGSMLVADPFYNPNLSLDTGAFELAWPPRGSRP